MDTQALLDFDQLQAAVTAAKQRFELIQKKYPELKTYLVLSLLGQQVEIDGSPKDILTKFPAMVVDNEAKIAALDTLSRIERLEWRGDTGTETQLLMKTLDQIVPLLRYLAKSQVEVRFKDLNYELVWKLQTDDLVDHNLTARSKTSIRIVLGTLSQFI